MFFRDIIQRVADVMIIFCFMHLADAVAVRNNFMQVIRISDPVLTHAECDLTKSLFDMDRVWLEAFSGEQGNS